MAKRQSSQSRYQRLRSNLRVETLERRQLLATVTGSGTEVGPNISHSNGQIYDQVLMTGSSVVVTADPKECSFQFNPVGTAKFTSPCDIAKTALVKAGCR